MDEVETCELWKLRHGQRDRDCVEHDLEATADPGLRDRLTKAGDG